MSIKELEAKIRKIIHNEGFDMNILTPNTIENIIDRVKTNK